MVSVGPPWTQREANGSFAFMLNTDGELTGYIANKEKNNYVNAERRRRSLHKGSREHIRGLDIWLILVTLESPVNPTPYVLFGLCEEAKVPGESPADTEGTSTQKVRD